MCNDYKSKTMVNVSLPSKLPNVWDHAYILIYYICIWPKISNSYPLCSMICFISLHFVYICEMICNIWEYFASANEWMFEFCNCVALSCYIASWALFITVDYILCNFSPKRNAKKGQFVSFSTHISEFRFLWIVSKI